MQVWEPDDPRRMEWVEDLERVRAVSIAIFVGLGIAIAGTACAMAFLAGLRSASCPSTSLAAPSAIALLETGNTR